MTTPTTVAHYLIERELGRGGMGVVLLATDTRLGRKVAIKSMPDEVARDQVRRTRFERESRILAAINHPNVAAIYGLEEADGRCYIVLELAEGVTLSERLSPREPLPLMEALGIAQQICSGLEAAHRCGIVHRDLKPDNVKIRPDGVVKVLDFGIAYAGSQGLADPLAATIVGPAVHGGTLDGSMLGTPGYMSPEQVRGRAAGTAADTWALGCVLFECLTGTPAFDGETTADLLAATLMREPEWSRLSAAAPEPAATLVRACLQKDPARRPEGMTAVIRDLEHALAAARSPAIRVRVPARETRPPEPLPPEASAFIGRDGELGAIGAMVRASPVVTVTGPGGYGKTRVVLRVAAGADGMRPSYVGLAPLADQVYVRRALARAARAEDDTDSGLVQAVGDRPLLLVLDGCEYAPGACAAVAALLASECPAARVLATGRHPLGVAGEAVHALPPMGAPSPTDEGAVFEAAVLFLRRAREARPGFTPTPDEARRIAQLCRVLGGTPLAVEIAAAGLAAFGVGTLADRLEQRTRLAGASLRVDDRVRLAIDWRLDTFQPPQRGAIKRLSLFPGGATVRALAAVCGAEDSMPRPGDDSPFGPPLTPTELRFAEIVESLERAALIRRVPGDGGPGGARWVLPGPVREVAADELAGSRDAAAAGARLTAYYRALAEQALPRLQGPAGAGWRARLGAELANLHGAAGMASRAGDAAGAERIAEAAGRGWKA